MVAERSMALNVMPRGLEGRAEGHWAMELGISLCWVRGDGYEQDGYEQDGFGLWFHLRLRELDLKCV